MLHVPALKASQSQPKVDVIVHTAPDGRVLYREVSIRRVRITQYSAYLSAFKYISNFRHVPTVATVDEVQKTILVVAS
jgi:hypothetical protein